MKKLKLRLQLLKLMRKTKMNYSTKKGVLKLLKNEKDMIKTIDYIKKYENLITNHQLRQYIGKILLQDKN